MAKGIGSGFPMGALVAREGLTFNAGEHGSTFAGGPLACAAALATLDVLKGVLPDVAKKGEILMKELAAFSPRGMGLIIGIPAGEERAKKIYNLCLKNGVIVNCASHGAIRLVPPLTISEEEIKTAAAVIKDAFEKTA